MNKVTEWKVSDEPVSGELVKQAASELNEALLRIVLDSAGSPFDKPKSDEWQRDA